MSICQRRAGTGWLVKYKDAATGKWRQRQFQRREAAEAFDLAARVAVQKDRALSLRDAVGAFIQGKPLARKRAERFLYLVDDDGPAAFLGDRYVSSLTRTDLEALRSALLARGCRPSTVNHYVDMIKTALKWCAAEDLVASDPWQKYGRIPAKKERRAGSLDDLVRVYRRLPDWMRWAVRTALALCLRPGMKELFGLTWDRFDWKEGAVLVYMAKSGRDKTVFAPQWYLAEAWPRFLADREAGQTRVCRGARNRALVAHAAYSKPWRLACDEAGVRMPFYAIRHIAASEMLAAGADLAAVAAQLGHRDITTTAQFYTHAIRGGQKRAASALPDTRSW